MATRRDPSRRLLGFARRMRHEPTDTERRLWSILRSRQLDGYKFRRQYPVDGYILDFYCVQHRLAVEADGGQHNDVVTMEYDARRTRSLASNGIRVVRFADNDVLREPAAVAEAVLRELESRPAAFARHARQGGYPPAANGPHPGPLPQAGEGEEREPPARSPRRPAAGDGQ